MPATVSPEDNFREIKIENGIVLKVVERPSRRNDPYNFYDQSVPVIPHLYPNSTILAKRRFGRLGEVFYSIVCYKEGYEDRDVMIMGTSIYKGNALQFTAIVSEKSFGDSLLVILEAVEKITSNKIG